MRQDKPTAFIDKFGGQRYFCAFLSEFYPIDKKFLSGNSNLF